MKTVTTTQLLAHISLCYVAGIWFGKHVPLPIWTGSILLLAYLALVHVRPLHCHSRRKMMSVILATLLSCTGNGLIQVKLQNPIPVSMYGKEVRFHGRLA